MRNYERYRTGLDGIPGVDLVLFDEHERCNFQYVVVQVDESVSRVSRDELLEVLGAENVLARRYFYPGIHHLAPYRLDAARGPDLPATESLASRVLVVPTGTAVTPEDVDQVCEIVRVAVENGASLDTRLAARDGRALRR